MFKRSSSFKFALLGEKCTYTQCAELIKEEKEEQDLATASLEESGNYTGNLSMGDYGASNKFDYNKAMSDQMRIINTIEAELYKFFETQGAKIDERRRLKRETNSNELEWIKARFRLRDAKAKIAILEEMLKENQTLMEQKAAKSYKKEVKKSKSADAIKSKDVLCVNDRVDDLNDENNNFHFGSLVNIIREDPKEINLMEKFYMSMKKRFKRKVDANSVTHMAKLKRLEKKVYYKLDKS